MYRAKRDRVGSHEVLDLRELHLAGHQAGLARGLPGAMGRGELHLDYQPIVDAVDGRLTGVEALLRWTHPSRGAVSPTVFIPFAEQSGQIVELGHWVLEQAWSDRQRLAAHSADADRHVGQRVRPPVHVRRVRAGVRRCSTARRPTPAVDPGGHRERVRPRRATRAGRARRTQGARRQTRARRLRDRLLLARLSQHAADRHDQDRPGSSSPNSPPSPAVRRSSPRSSSSPTASG